MTLKTFCGSPDHAVSRRGFLTSMAALAGTAAFADMTGIQVLGTRAMAQELRRQQKRIIMLWLAGGASQMETFDPKPGVPTGGPFQSIQTSSTGVRISELMPRMARRLKDTCIIRSLNTRNADHGSAAKIMMRGRMGEAAVDYPDLGAVMAREMGQEGSQVPDYVSFYTATEGRNMAPGHAGFLGARYGSMDLTTSMVPENIRRAGVSDQDHRERAELRRQLSSTFENGRTSASLDSHNQAYQRVSGIMANERLFDIEQEPLRIRERYGNTLFGKQALAARRLCEAGVPFVRVGRAWWDSHAQNFESHQEMVPELDNVMATLLDDLEDRGLLQNTLVITLAEFGRTPSINASLGRDHFASAWSTTLSGCGVRGGTVYGRSDESGNRVAEGEVNAARLFATIYRALGINHHKNYYLGARPIPLTDPGTEPIREVLARKVSKPYDSGVRVLIEQYLPDWLALAPRKAQGPVRVIDSDLSTITAEADKVVYVEDPVPWILHLEPQANWDGSLEQRLSWYNELLSYKHGCLVHTALVLLRRQAESPRLTGEYVQQFASDPPYRIFRYQVIRVWHLSADALISGGLGMLPLAPLCDDARPRLPDVFERMAGRLQQEVADLPELALLWKTTAILADMCYDQDVILPLMRKVMAMVKLEDFPSYAKGEAKGRRETIIELGTKVLGNPDAETVAILNSINDLDRFHRMTNRLLEVKSWQELLSEK